MWLRVPAQAAPPPAAASSGCRGSAPSPWLSVRCCLRWVLAHTPPNGDIPSHPSGADGAGSGGAETLGFRGGSACSDPSAVTQLMPQYGQVSPPAAALASPGPGWQSIPLSDTMSPDHPNHPGGGQGGRWASGWQSPLPQSPQLWGQWSCWGLQVWRYPTLTRASLQAALAPSSPVRPQLSAQQDPRHRAGEKQSSCLEAATPPARSRLNRINTRLIEALINSDSAVNGAPLVNHL